MKRRNTLESPAPAEVGPAEGIRLLQIQITKGQELLKSRPIASDDYSSWKLVTRNCLEKAFGMNSPNVSDIIEVGAYGSFPGNAGEEWWERHRAKSLQTQLKTLDGLVELLNTELQSAGSGAVQSQPNPLTALQYLEGLVKRFPIAARQVSYRHDNRETLRINDEYDVQDFLHVLLKAFFDDVRPEEPTPSHAGASSRIDFLLKNERIVVEVKMTNDKLKDKQVGDQLIIDIRRYQSHPDCGTLVCLVYDPSHHISNPAALEKDLSGKHDNLEVRAFVVPH